MDGTFTLGIWNEISPFPPTDLEQMMRQKAINPKELGLFHSDLRYQAAATSNGFDRRKGHSQESKEIKQQKTINSERGCSNHKSSSQCLPRRVWKKKWKAQKTAEDERVSIETARGLPHSNLRYHTSYCTVSKEGFKRRNEKLTKQVTMRQSWLTLPCAELI